MNGNNGSASYDLTYFYSFQVEYIPKEIKKIIRDKNIRTSIYRTQVYSTIMCEYFCIGFIGFMLKVMLCYVSITIKIRVKKFIALFVVSIENSKPLKYHRSLKKH